MQEYWATATPEQIIADFEKLGVELDDSEAQKILWKYQMFDDNPIVYTEENVLLAMKKYARLMCDQQKQICAENSIVTASILQFTYSVTDRYNNIIRAPYPPELQDDKT